MDAQRQRHVVEGGQMVNQPDVLKHHADAPAHRCEAIATEQRGVVAEHDKPAGRRHAQEPEQAEQRGLAGAARSHDEHELAPLEGQIDFAQDLRPRAIAHRDVFKPEHAALPWLDRVDHSILRIARQGIFVQWFAQLTRERFPSKPRVS
jgi:hypothetical protein